MVWVIRLPIWIQVAMLRKRVRRHPNPAVLGPQKERNQRNRGISKKVAGRTKTGIFRFRIEQGTDLTGKQGKVITGMCKILMGQAI